MKQSKVKLEDEGFEEIPIEEKAAERNTNENNSASASAGGSGIPGKKPDFRIVQTDRDKDGNVVYLSVGGMWKNVSKNGNEFYSLKIGQLKLLVFPNNK